MLKPFKLLPLSPAPDWVSTLLASVFCTIFSPSLWLLQMALSPWIDWHSLLREATSSIDLFRAFYALTLQLKSLGPVVLFTQLLPLLLLGVGLSLGYYWLILQLFNRASQRLQRSHPTIS